MALLFGGHLVGSADFKGNLEQRLTSSASRGTKWGKTGHQCSGVRKGHPWVAFEVWIEGKEKEKREKEQTISEFPLWLGKAKD